MAESTELKRTLGPVMLWALGVGYVISGMYFGWNLGLPEGGPYGLLAATLFVTVMYVAFVLGYAELSCAIPRAGGAFLYASAAFGPGVGLLAGVAQCIEFVFAPPAIASAIAAYIKTVFPATNETATAIAAYALFTGLNVWGVKQSAIFELVVTVLAVGELLLFAAITAPRFSLSAFSQDALPHGWAGALSALPYAIWFYLAIEGIANTAEEARDPQKVLPRGFGWAMATLVVLSLLTFFCAVGVGGWQKVVFEPGKSTPSDSPLPLALGQVVGASHPLYHLVVSVGLCGLLASFHGIILVAGRATMEFGRVGYAPAWLGKVLPGRNTPAFALGANMLVGVGALLTGRTSDIITVSVFGALTMYVVASASVVRLRSKMPDLERPFRVPLYPITPLLALVASLVCLGAMAVYQTKMGLVFFTLIAGAYGWFYAAVPRDRREAQIELL